MLPAAIHPDPVQLELRTYADGDVLWRAGDGTPAGLYLVKEGMIRLFRPGTPKKPILFAFARKGDLVLTDPEGREDLFAVARGPTQAWFIPGDLTDRIVFERPTLAVSLFSALSDQVRRLRRRAAVAQEEVPARIAGTVLALGEAMGEDCAHGKGQVDLRGVTQQDLAEMVGASRPFVSTLVNVMKRKGLIASYGRTLCIQDRAGLARVVKNGRV